jgi:hypothetical protein
MEEINKGYERVVENATGKIYLDRPEWQTCWIVTKSGYLLTSGHGFYDDSKNPAVLRERKDKEYQIEIKGYPNLTAHIVEAHYDKLAYLDYALLKIHNEQDYEFPFIPVCSKFDCCKDNEFFARGYRQTAGQYQTGFSGNITGAAFRNDAISGKYFQLSVVPEDLEGMSGSAVCVRCRKRPETLAVGIQTSQIKLARNNAIAVPLMNVKKFSKTFQQILLDQEERKIRPLEIDVNSFETSNRYVDEEKRLFVFIVPHPDIDVDADKLYTSFLNVWDTYSKEILERAKKIPWLKRNFKRISLDQNCVQPDIDNQSKSLLDADIVGKQTVGIKGMRALFDLSGKYLSLSMRNDVRVEHNLSHFIGIQFSEDGEGIGFAKGFDSQLLIRKDQMNASRQNIYNAIEDIFFDCYALFFKNVRKIYVFLMSHIHRQSLCDLA